MRGAPLRDRRPSWSAAGRVRDSLPAARLTQAARGVVGRAWDCAAEKSRPQREARAMPLVAKRRARVAAQRCRKRSGCSDRGSVETSTGSDPGCGMFGSTEISSGHSVGCSCTSSCALSDATCGDDRRCNRDREAVLTDCLLRGLRRAARPNDFDARNASASSRPGDREAGPRPRLRRSHASIAAHACRSGGSASVSLPCGVQRRQPCGRSLTLP